MSTALSSSPSKKLDQAWLADAGLRGRVAFQEPLRDHCWFRVGGPAEIFFQPADSDDLAAFLRACPADMPLTTLGLGSNLLVRDGGIDGVVVKLGPAFARVQVEAETLIAGAAAPDLNVARAAANAGLGGLVFLCGIPGSVGGAVRMNAGCYGSEIKDVLIGLTAFDRRGTRLEITRDACGFAYRSSALPPDLIVTQARFKGTQADPAELQDQMRALQQKRGESQPIRTRTSGSTFANPEGDPEGRKAWQLIDLAGCRGLRRGGAQVSEQHCNFLINTGDATAADIEGLGEDVRNRVREKFGIDLRWEIRRIGRAATEAC